MQARKIEDLWQNQPRFLKRGVDFFWQKRSAAGDMDGDDRITGLNILKCKDRGRYS